MTKYQVVFTHLLMSTVPRYVHRMTVREILQKFDFRLEITRFFHKNQEWREYANVDILKCKQKMRNEELILISLCLLGV